MNDNLTSLIWNTVLLLAVVVLVLKGMSAWWCALLMFRAWPESKE